jgi:hypothetical protein
VQVKQRLSQFDAAEHDLSLALDLDDGVYTYLLKSSLHSGFTF